MPKIKKRKQKDVSEQDPEPTPIPPEGRLIPFVDATFTGQQVLREGWLLLSPS